MKNTLAILFIIIFSTTLYALTLHGISGNPEAATIKQTLEEPTKPFELSPERGRFAHIIALAETGKYALTKELGEFVYPDVGWNNGKFYSFFAPGMSYMALPFYIIGSTFNHSQLFTFGFVSLVSILAMVFLFKICRDIFNLPVWSSIAVVMIFGFGSTAWSYAVTLYQHHLTVFFILSSFYAVWYFGKNIKWSWLGAIWVWLAYALAITIDYPNALLMLPVMVYFLISALNVEKNSENIKIKIRTSFILTVVFFALVMFGHLVHNKNEFGSITNLSGGLTSYKTIVENNWQELSVNEINLKLNENIAKKDVVGFFTEEKIPSSPGTLLFSKDRGLFVYTPIFILGVLGILYVVRKRVTLESGVLLSLIGVNLFLYASWGDPWGGWAYGPRYLIPSMSILAIFSGIFLSYRPTWWKSLVAFVLFTYSSAIALLGVLTTNSVPPRVEADSLGMKYNFLRNLEFFYDNKSSSYVYNHFLSDNLSLVGFAFSIYSLLIIIFLIIVMVTFVKDKDHV